MKNTEFELTGRIVRYEVLEHKYLGDNQKTPHIIIKLDSGDEKAIRVPAQLDTHDFRFWLLQYRGRVANFVVWFSSYRSRVGSGDTVTLCHKSKPSIFDLNL
ncbi:hypothetical protein VCHA29O37_680006 [Vibrio chagasii]|nr:hypothetical protein VCHA29O37_680006 [Vibrio chagasii]